MLKACLLLLCHDLSDAEWAVISLAAADSANGRHACIHGAQFSTRFFTNSAPAARGVFCPRNGRRGKWSTMIFASGD